MSHEQPSSDLTLIGRRQALCTFAGIATAAAGVGLFGVGTAHAAGVRSTSETVTAEQAGQLAEHEATATHELALVDALIPGDLNLGKWSLEKVHAGRLGAIAVVMRGPAGEAFQVDVLRREDGVKGISDTRHFSVFVANAGDGSTRTDELQARGAMVLAHHIRRTEVSGAPLPELMSFSERSRRHPFGGFGVLD